MSSQIHRTLIELLAAKPAALANEIVLQDHAQGSCFTGKNQVEGVLRAFSRDSFADSRAEVHSRIADKVAMAVEFTFCGHQTGAFFGIPPTGCEVNLPMALVCRIERGKIWRIALYYDAGALLRQLGLGLGSDPLPKVFGRK